jgi:hypothetical protein
VTFGDVNTGSAVSREAAWLATSGDGIPALLTSAGGPWGIVQAYWPGTRFATQKTGVYVQRTDIADLRANSQRIRPGYSFTLKLVWPVKSSTVPLAETEAQNLDNAVDLLLQRIRGPLGDKTHGGRFLSVGETPGRPSVVTVRFDDPEQTIPAQKAIRAVVSYNADDYEIND